MVDPWLPDRLGPPAPHWGDNRRNQRRATVGGQEYVFYTIGALAEALRRKPVTIKMWLSKRYIPESTWRQPGFPEAFGSSGVRLWTRAQIEELVALAVDEKMLDGRPQSMSRTNFPERARNLWATQGW